MAGEPVVSDPAAPRSPAGRRDAVRNYHRILEAARDVLGESGADASMEEIAARAGVGVGTVYRRFANKDALIDELLRLSMDEGARRRQAGPGLPGRRRPRVAAARARGAVRRARPVRAPAAAAQHRRRGVAGDAGRGRGADRRALAAGTLNPGVTFGDVMALIWAMRGLTETTGGVAPEAWQRFLDIHLAGLRAAGPLSASPAMSAGQLSELLPPLAAGQP